MDTLKKINVVEFNLIVSNFVFAIGFFPSIKKKRYFDFVALVGIVVFSSIYHSCYDEIIKSDQTYLMQWMCPFNENSIYKSVTLFLDMFFANLNFYLTISYLLLTDRQDQYRYAVITPGLIIIVIIGAYAGFFPTSDTQYPDVKSYYVTAFSTIFINLLFLIHLILYIQKLITNFGLNPYFNEQITKTEYVWIKIKRFYKKRNYIPTLIISFLIGFSGLFIWLVLENFFSGIYEVSHFIWHLLSAIARTLFLYSIKIY